MGLCSGGVLICARGGGGGGDGCMLNVLLVFPQECDKMLHTLSLKI